MKLKTIIIVLCGALLLSVAAGAITPNEKVEREFIEAIKANDNYEFSAPAKEVGRVGTRVVKENELENVKKSHALAGKELTDSEAFDRLARNEVLYQRAVALGHQATEEEIQELEADFLAGLENSLETKSLMDALLSELDMTAEDYVESVRAVTERDITIAKYKKAVMSEKRNAYMEYSNEDYEADWAAHVDELIQNAEIERGF